MAKEECCDGGCNCKQMLPTILLVLIMLGGLYMVGTSVINQSVAPNEEVNTISVSGEAKTTATPDETVIYFTIETLDDSSTVSQSENADIYDEVKKALLALGVKAEDIETTSYYFELDKQGHWVCPDDKPDCNYDEQVYTEDVLGYKTTHSLSVTYKGTEKAGQLVDAIVSNGVEEIDYVYFQLSEETRKELEELNSLAEKGEIILLFEDETVLWRFALPRKGWWIKKIRKRIPHFLKSKNQIKKEEKESNGKKKSYKEAGIKKKAR